MCYTGKCLFENHMGDCTVDILKFKDKYKFGACIVGGAPSDPEDEQYIKDNAAALDNILKQYRADQEAEHKRRMDMFAAMEAKGAGE